MPIRNTMYRRTPDEDPDPDNEMEEAGTDQADAYDKALALLKSDAMTPQNMHEGLPVGFAKGIFWYEMRFRRGTSPGGRRRAH